MTSATGQDHEALVIGAGVAGLSTAVELGRRGVGALVLERSGDVGSSWQGRYDGLRLNTYRRLSSALHGRIPRSAGRWPSREALVEHLRESARRERIAIEFGTSVRRVDRVEAGGIPRSTPRTVPSRRPMWSWPPGTTTPPGFPSGPASSPSRAS